MISLTKIWDTVKSWFHSATDEVHVIVDAADKVADEFKALEQSQIGQFLQTALLTAFPALAPAFSLWLPNIFTTLKWASDELDKTDEAKVQDALNYLNTLKGTDLSAYATQINSLNALIQKFISDNQGAGLTIQQALTVAQVVHDPTAVTA